MAESEALKKAHALLEEFGVPFENLHMSSVSIEKAAVLTGHVPEDRWDEVVWTMTVGLGEGSRVVVSWAWDDRPANVSRETLGGE